MDIGEALCELLNEGADMDVNLKGYCYNQYVVHYDSA